jgi:hypothetical protein
MAYQIFSGLLKRQSCGMMLASGFLGEDVQSDYFIA